MSLPVLWNPLQPFEKDAETAHADDMRIKRGDWKCEEMSCYELGVCVCVCVLAQVIYEKGM